MRRRMAGTLLLAMILTILFSNTVFAHGESAQESFLRTQTIVFYDVKFSGDTLEQNETLTITGKFKILETWPETMEEPDLAYLSVVSPGPVMVMKERYINDQPAPHSIRVEKGGNYSFKMVLEGRKVGRWHLHPGVAVKGSGTLLGPGQWVEVKPSATGFTNPLTLLNGKTVNLDNYAVSLVVVLSFLGFALTIWYLLYWIINKRTITGLPVHVRLPLNDDGARLGIITRRDHRFVSMMAALSVVLLLGGWGYAAYAYPDPIPQQVIRFKPEPLKPDAPNSLEVKSDVAYFDEASDNLTMNVTVTNNGDEAVNLTEFNSANLVWSIDGGTMSVPGGTQIKPGEERELKISIKGDVLEEENLLPFDTPQPWLAGVLFFEDSQQRRQLVTIKVALKRAAQMAHQ